MKIPDFLPTHVESYFENNNDPLIPELWAMESLAILEENMVMGNLVYRDFENTLASYGSVVHTRRPATFTGQRKTDADSVTVQDASSTDVLVPLNQWIHVSFIIKDGEQTKAFKNLVDFYLRPALLAGAQMVDRILSGQAIQFIGLNGGTLGGLTTSNAADYILAVNEVLNVAKCPTDQRNLVITPTANTKFLGTPLFVQAQQVGDGGNALRTASLGRTYGFDVYMAQNTPQVASGSVVATAFVVNLSAGYAAGTTTMTIGTGTGIIQTGTFFTVAGDNVPQRVTAHTETTGNTTSITFFPGLKSAVANAAVLTVYTPGQINQASSGTFHNAAYASGYPAKWTAAIVVDGFTVAPKVGQPISFGDGLVYCIASVGSTTSITLDRPLDLAVLDNAYVCVGPTGSYNFAFRRNALALVVRPLNTPMAGTGARSAVVDYNNLAVRVTITYDGNKQGHLVTIDFLCGVAVLDLNQGAVLLG